MDSKVLKTMPHTLKKYLISFISAAKKLRLKLKLLIQIRKQASPYNFTIGDINLYIAEVFTSLLRLTVCVDANAEFLKVSIGGVTIYWPASQSTRDLPWLFHEVFDEYTTNPSSYNNPNLGYPTRSWIIDAGAAEGYFSVFALQNSKARLICIEPLSLMKSALQKTLEMHSNGKPSIMVKAGIGDKKSLANIQLDANYICDSRFIADIESEQLGAQESIFTTELVPITTLDALAAEYNLQANGMIKMDIEGYEMAALIGAIDLMKHFKPSLAIAVYHELDNANKCAEIIRSANPTYKIEIRGFYAYFNPPRPYMIFAY